MCYIIIEGKSYTLENSKTKFTINKKLSCNSKTVVYIIECKKCKEVNNIRIQFNNSNIILPENRKRYVSKHLFECGNGTFKTVPLYKTND